MFEEVKPKANIFLKTYTSLNLIDTELDKI